MRDLRRLKRHLVSSASSSTDEAERASRECRYALPGLKNNIPLLMAGGISAFVLVIAAMALLIVLPFVRASQLAADLLIALAAFVLIYVCFVIYLLRRGYAIGKRLQVEIDQKFAPAAPPTTNVMPGSRQSNTIRSGPPPS